MVTYIFSIISDYTETERQAQPATVTSKLMQVKFSRAKQKGLKIYNDDEIKKVDSELEKLRRTIKLSFYALVLKHPVLKGPSYTA